MKVLMTHEIFPPDIAGGGEVVTKKISKLLLEKGIELKVLTTGNPKITEFDGIKTIRLPINRYLMNFAIPQVYREALDVDLIQTNNYNACFPSYVTGKLLKKPVICLVHEVYNKKWYEMRGPILGNLSRIIERLQVRHDFDKFIFFGNYMRGFAVSIGIPREKTRIIKPGVDLKKFKPKKKEPFVLFVGHMIKRKGLDYLLEAAKELKDIRFVMVGRGEELERLKSIAPKNVIFTGFIPEKEKIDLFSRALVFCLPSVGEGFGFVLLEAMASGCSIVSTAPLEFHGRRVEYSDVKQLKVSIEYLVNNQDVATKMGRGNRKLAETYDWDDFIKKLIKLYEESLSSRV